VTTGIQTSLLAFPTDLIIPSRSEGSKDKTNIGELYNYGYSNNLIAGIIMVCLLVMATSGQNIYGKN
jgi:hypothetical protein